MPRRNHNRVIPRSQLQHEPGAGSARDAHEHGVVACPLGGTENRITVIDLAFYQGGMDGLRLGEEFHHNGLNLRCAQINRMPRQLAHDWDQRRLALETLHLLADEGDLIREHMITHVVPYDDAPGFLRHLVQDRPEFLQIVFAHE